MVKDKDNNKINSSNSLVFGRWLQTKSRVKDKSNFNYIHFFDCIILPVSEIWYWMSNCVFICSKVKSSQVDILKGEEERRKSKREMHPVVVKPMIS